MSTIENTDYAAPGIQVCSVCKLHAKDLVGTPPRCPTTQRCHAVRTHQSLGGPVWPGKTDKFALTEMEHQQVGRAVSDFRTARAHELADRAISCITTLDDVNASAPLDSAEPFA